MSLSEKIRNMPKKGLKMEAIPLREDGDPLVLLRFAGIPTIAFVVFTTRKTGTATQMSLRQDSGGFSGRYSVACACCPIETYGFEEPQAENDAMRKSVLENWKKDKATEFKSLMQHVCDEHDVRVILMRRASSWDEHFGTLDGIHTHEASDFVAAYTAQIENNINL